MPTKKVVVKSETAVAPSPALELPLAKPARKRSTATGSTKKTAVETTITAEKQVRANSGATSRTKKKSEQAAVTHRHKKQETGSLEITATTAVTSAPAVTFTRAPYEPSHEEVAKLAYSYYEARGHQPGDPRTDWFRAVQELKARHAAATSLLED